MPRHNIQVEDSFAQSLGLLSARAQEEISAIVRALEADPYYLPDQESFIVEVDNTRNVACQNIDGWDGWWLVWFLEYSSIVPTIPEYVILMLRHFGDRPLKVIEPFKDEAGGDDRATALGTEAAAALAWLTRREPKEQEKDSEPNYSRVRIFYATDRQEQSDPEYGVGYEALRSPDGILRYGECEVCVPKTHKQGRLESPSIFRLEFRPDPNKHVVLAKITSLGEERFLEVLSGAITSSAARETFVFVHGYNVTFDDAARRTAQIAFDLHFAGAPILYSWPSNGRVADYMKDETNVAWSAPHFERFLKLMASKSGAARIHVIAHSMGNRVVCEALKSLSYQPANGLKFNHLVLAAPDIDADTFRELAATLRGVSERITLYQSSNDKAILASRCVHGNPRAAEPVLIIPGIDTIDASEVDTDFLGHSLFCDSPRLLQDLFYMLSADKLPPNRFGLDAMTNSDGLYYVFRP